LDDADEPRSEVSVLFEEESLGITEEEAWLYDDDDELFMENPLPEQIGDGIAPPDVNQMDTLVKASGFWDRIPVVGPVSLDRAIILQERSRRVIRRYDGEETTYFALIDPTMLPESAQDSTLGNSIEVVRMLFERLLVQTTRNLSPHDLIRIILEDDTLDRPISTFIMKVSDMSVDAIMNAVPKVLQSKDEIKLDAGFSVNVSIIRRPRGGGRNRRMVNPEVDRLKKGSVLTITKDDSGLCCSSAILLGLAVHNTDPELRTLKNQSCDLLKRRAIQLHSQTGVPEGPCGFTEVAIFERHLNVQVVIISTENMNQVVYKGAERPKKVYLWFNNNHYDLIRSPKGFYATNEYCEECVVLVK
ncbi:hypothetical protein JTE90_019019, partial [Oedothorax gibbosus]